MTPDASTVAGESLGVVGVRDFATRQDTVLDKTQLVAPKSLVYSNILDHNKNFGRHLLNDVYAERVCNVNDISICQMPSKTIVYGGGGFLTGSRDCLLAEQIHPNLRDQEALLKIIREPRGDVVINGPHLLVARYGEATWGHWIVDLLPKIVIAETFFPNRFTYVVPGNVPLPPSIAYRRILESLSAYGIQRDRLLGIWPSKNHVFDDLSAVTEIQSNGLMHPAAHDLMNRRLMLSPLPPTQRVALLRTETPWSRNVTNLPAVRDDLVTRGFDVRSPAEMSFLEQVACFQEARTIVGVLGSGLTGLLYSPYGVRVMSLAPPAFGDRFFYGLTQLRNGRYADLRGPVSVQNDKAPDRDSHFEIDVAEIGLGLDALSA